MTIIRKEKKRKEKGVREEKRDVAFAFALAHGRSGGGGCALGFLRRHNLWSPTNSFHANASNKAQTSPACDAARRAQRPPTRISYRPGSCYLRGVAVFETSQQQITQAHTHTDRQTCTGKQSPSAGEGVLLTIHHLPLLVQPALGLILPLQDNVVALKPAREVVPRGGDHGVLALEILDDLFVGGLREKVLCQPAERTLGIVSPEGKPRSIDML